MTDAPAKSPENLRSSTFLLSPPAAAARKLFRSSRTRWRTPIVQPCFETNCARYPKKLPSIRPPLFLAGRGAAWAHSKRPRRGQGVPKRGPRMRDECAGGGGGGPPPPPCFKLDLRDGGVDRNRFVPWIVSVVGPRGPFQPTGTSLALPPPAAGSGLREIASVIRRVKCAGPRLLASPCRKPCSHRQTCRRSHGNIAASLRARAYLRQTNRAVFQVHFRFSPTRSPRASFSFPGSAFSPLIRPQSSVDSGASPCYYYTYSNYTTPAVRACRSRKLHQPVP